LTHSGSLCAWTAVALLPLRAAEAISFGGDVSVTSDYIYRGLSESNGHPAAQLDLHAGTTDGSFVGVWTSTRDHNLEPGADYDIQVYLGHRFNLGTSWSATLTGLSYYYVGGNQDLSNDYQEISASVAYLDRWTFSVSSIPNAVRYGHYGPVFYRLGRYPAVTADMTGQWLLREGLFLTAGAGYYDFTSSGTSSGTSDAGTPSSGYLYGNAGLAFEHQAWRLDVGYFFAQQAAQRLFPYPVASHRVAATLSWHF
jgi:uncharacterized protein (TIGR02001 family)